MSRSLPVLAFLAKHERLAQKHVMLLWDMALPGTAADGTYVRNDDEVCQYLHRRRATGVAWSICGPPLHL